MVMGYWSVAILFWQLSIDQIVCVIYKRWGLAKTRLRHPSLLIVSPTLPVQSVDAYVRTYARSVTWQPYSMSMGLCPTRASRAREPCYKLCLLFFFCQWTPVLQSLIVVEDSSVRTSNKFIHFYVTYNSVIQSLRRIMPAGIQCKTDPVSGILNIWHTPYPDQKFTFNTLILVLQLLVSKKPHFVNKVIPT